MMKIKTSSGKPIPKISIQMISNHLKIRHHPPKAWEALQLG
jgi:hypothetical protein